MSGHRRFIAVPLLVLFMFIALLPAGQARVLPQNDVSIFIDGEQVVFPDQQPFIDENSRTMVPARFFAEALGAAVDWNAASQEATISREGTLFSCPALTITVGDNDVLLHPDQHQTMDTVAIIKNDRLMIPLRFISSYLNCDINWDSQKRMVHIFTQGQSETEQQLLTEDTKKSPQELPRVNSAENMQTLLDESMSGDYYRLGSPKIDMAFDTDMIMEESTALNNTPAPTMQSTAPAYSGTNVQVEGVDEADIVKCDGEYIYMLKDNELLLIQAYPASSLSVKARIQLEENPRDIFIDHNRLIIISDYYDYEPYPIREDTLKLKSDMEMMPPYRSRNGLIVSTYDTNSKSNPVKIDTFKMEGSYLSSRKIDSNIYVISSQYVYAPCQPVYYINDTPVEKDYSEIRYFPDILHNTYLHIGQINLDSKDNKFSLETYLSSGSSIYCSADNLYITASEYTPFLYDYDHYTAPTESTLIFKFNLDKGVNYSAKGIVPGIPLNQFSMDEYDGNFRIAATINQWSGSNSENAVYILDNDLDQINSVTGIAPGEKIYSARFMSERLYLVTFKQIDPFFVLDLNPQNPKILGKLKIPGFSDYLHPYRDNYVIGLGYDTSTTKNGGVIQSGIKVSMFDVSDVSNPVEIDKTVIGTSGSHSEACDNHRAFLLYNDLLAFPATVYESYAGDNSYYGTFEFQGAYIFGVSKNGFDYTGRVTHLDEEDYLKAGNYWYNSDENIRRIIIIDDNLYTISNEFIKINDSSTLRQINLLSTAD